MLCVDNNRTLCCSGYDGQHTCITYDAVNQAYVEARKRICEYLFSLFVLVLCESVFVSEGTVVWDMPTLSILLAFRCALAYLIISREY